LAASIIFLEILIFINGIWKKINGRVVQANGWGKIKMALQVIGVALIFGFLIFKSPIFIFCSWIILIFSLVMGTISFFTYSL